MRVLALLTHSTTLFILQQIVIVWFLVDFFLARDSSTTNKLFNEHISRSAQALQTIEKINSLTNSTCNELIYQRATVDKVILIVIDALGSEFVQAIPKRAHEDRPIKMPFLEQTLVQHQSMGFVAKAATPTVTMPRIKALVSGTIPSFMDVVYNLASDKADFHEDNILRIAKSRGKSIVFYGDDTWISLFGKSMFKRSRETLSLYASDYTSVDTNVTEMALPETKRDPIDWDFLILHYLGLDHIGHVFGTNQSPLIDKKLLEMDSLIHQVHSNMAAKNFKSLIIICGDHGMSSEGNHGGGSRLETETAMLFLPVNEQFSGKNIDHDTPISQIDLAVTLSLLAGLPIPAFSRGVLIEPLLKNIWQDDAALRLACANTENLKQLTPLLDDKELLAPDGLGTRVLQHFERLTANTSTQDISSLTRQGLDLASDMQIHLLKVVASKSNNFLVGVTIVLVMLLSIINMRRACNRLLMPLMSHWERLTCIGAVLVPVLMLNSTDFIEMEHLFWRLYSVVVFVLFCVVAIRSHSIESIKQDLDPIRLLLFVVTFVITISWNLTGSTAQHDWSWPWPVLAIIIMCNFTRQTSKLRGKQSLIFFAFGSLILATKYIEETAENHSNVVLQQVFTLVILMIGSVANLYKSTKVDTQATLIVQKLATSWMWWIFLLSRSRNYGFLISNVIMEASLNTIANSFQFNPIMRAITYLQFANNAFFCQGNTNLFASLDIKPAFYGQTQYNIILAVPLIACSTFGSQIYWYLKLFQRVQGEKEQERMSIRPRLIDQTNTSKLIPEGTKDAIKDFVDMRNFLTIAYYMFVCMVLRDHLFIWSVLSPKLVYLFMTTITIRLVTTTISNLPHFITKAFGEVESEVRYKKIID